ncbi:MAG: MATE family efflux transporter [Cyanobacteria bacterium J06554_11]
MRLKMLPTKAVNYAVKSGALSEFRSFLGLAIPLASAQIAQFAVSFVDTIMMGHLGTAQLAAGGLAASTFQMALTVITGFVVSVGVLAAEAIGATAQTETRDSDFRATKDNSRLTGLARQGMWMCLLISVPFTLLLLNMSPMLRLLQQSEDVTVLAQQYFTAIAFGVLPAMGFAMLRGYTSAFSLANVVTVIVLIGTAFNVACNYVLGFGKLGLPRLELVGLGIGSGLSLWLMFWLFVVYIFRHPLLQQYRFWRGWKHPNLSILRQLSQVGAPIAVTFSLELGLFSAVSYAAGSLGTEVLAAHQIAFQTIALIFMVPLGMSQATVARVGLWFGKGDSYGMRRAGIVAIACTVCFLSASSLALYIFRPFMVGLFLDTQAPENAAVVNLAMDLLLVSVAVQIMDGVQRVAMSALYGLQDTGVPMILSAIAYWGIGLTTSYLLCFFVGWGVVGLWIGQYTGIAVAGTIFVWRFWQLTRQYHHT